MARRMSLVRVVGNLFGISGTAICAALSVAPANAAGTRPLETNVVIQLEIRKGVVDPAAGSGGWTSPGRLEPSSNGPLTEPLPALAGNGAAPTAPSSAPIEIVPRRASPGMPPSYVRPAPPYLKAIVDAALADAAKRTGIGISALKVLSAEAVVWADGSLGCPMPGMAYTMALVPGHRVRIRAGNEVLDYHGGGRQLMLCPADRAIDPLPTQTS